MTDTTPRRPTRPRARRSAARALAFAIAAGLGLPGTARAQAQPFALDDLERIVQAGVIAEARLLTLIGERCVAFVADAASLDRLRRAGASPAVLDAVRRACRVLPGEPRWIRVETPQVETHVGDLVPARVTALAPDSTPIPRAEILWTSSDPNVVDIDRAGRAVARRPGIARLVARGTNGIESDPVTVIVTRPPSARKGLTTAILLGSLVPGGGQFYTGQGLKGAVLFAGAVATTVVGFAVTTDEILLGDPVPPTCVGTCTFPVTFQKKRPAVVPTLVAAGGLWLYGVIDAALAARATQEAAGPPPRVEWFARGEMHTDGTLTVPVLRIRF